MVIKLHTAPRKDEVFTGRPEEWPVGLYTKPDTGEIITVQPVNGLDPYSANLALYWKVNRSLPTSVNYTAFTWIKTPTGTRFEYHGTYEAP